MKKFNFPKGRRGEGIAGRYLSEQGYMIVERNFRTRWGEIDLVCTKRDVLVFVEVKLKVGENFGTPEEMVSKRKIEQVQRTAESFLMINPDMRKKYEKYRIDVVAIVLSEEGRVERIKHYENMEL